MEDSPLPPQITVLDDEALKLVADFKKRPEVQEYLLPKHNNFFIARYLRARKFVLEDAIVMFVNSMKWRRKMDVDTINERFQQNKFKDKLIEYWPASAFWDNPPLTNDGSIIIMEALGRVDPSIIDNVGLENLIQYHIWSMEQLEGKWFKTMETKGYWPGFVMIEDLQGLGWHSLSSKVLSVCQEIVSINQNYYPDMLRKMWVINIPSIFYMSWKVISLWLEPRTLVKIELNSGDFDSIKERVFKVIDPACLPIRLGGTSTREIGLGGPVKAPSKKLEHKVTWVEIGRSSYHETSFSFAEGDIVAWQFKTKSHDIGFAFVSYEKQEIVKMARHDSDKRVIEGSSTIKTSGTYLFKFDNTYSWTKGKQVKYNIKKNNEILFPKQ